MFRMFRHIQIACPGCVSLTWFIPRNQGTGSRSSGTSFTDACKRILENHGLLRCTLWL